MLLFLSCDADGVRSTSGLTEVEASEKLADVERTRKKLMKSVEQVALLRKRYHDGEVLEENQLAKVNRYNAMIAELGELDAKVSTTLFCVCLLVPSLVTSYAFLLLHERACAVPPAASIDCLKRFNTDHSFIAITITDHAVTAGHVHPAASIACSERSVGCLRSLWQ